GLSGRVGVTAGRVVFAGPLLAPLAPAAAAFGAAAARSGAELVEVTALTDTPMTVATAAPQGTGAAAGAGNPAGGRTTVSLSCSILPPGWEPGYHEAGSKSSCNEPASRLSISTRTGTCRRVGSPHDPAGRTAAPAQGYEKADARIRTADPFITSEVVALVRTPKRRSHAGFIRTAPIRIGR